MRKHSQDIGVCRFFNSPSGCREGNKCKWLHVRSEAKLQSELKLIPCKFIFSATGCMKGDTCPYSHDIQLRNSGNNVNNNNLHNSVEVEEEEDCNICFEVVNQPNQFGLLSDCNHRFCLQCIRKWRQNKNDSKNNLMCPICRTRSDYVVPSRIFAIGDIKQQIIDNYLKRLKNIPCKDFKFGKGQCSFGLKCFYSHLMEDGSEPPKSLFERPRFKRVHTHRNNNNSFVNILNLLNSIRNFELHSSSGEDEDIEHIAFDEFLMFQQLMSNNFYDPDDVFYGDDSDDDEDENDVFYDDEDEEDDDDDEEEDDEEDEEDDEEDDEDDYYSSE